MIKTVLCAGAFAVGFVAGQWNNGDIPPASAARLTQTPAPITCPVADIRESEPITSSPLDFSQSNSSTAEISAAASSEPYSPGTATEITLSDFTSPDEQIKLSLTANTDSFSQNSEQQVEEQDPLEPLFQLPEAEQLAYVQKLVESQEDAAVTALNDLILNDHTPIQARAIDGLISLLEMRTGHFDLIAENLQHNAVFLSDDQLRRVQKITQTDTSL